MVELTEEVLEAMSRAYCAVDYEDAKSSPWDDDEFAQEPEFREAHFGPMRAAVAALCAAGFDVVPRVAKT